MAFLYASVGHGGASGYLALMVLFSFASNDIRIVALTLNLFVAGISFIHFKREGHFNPKLFYPFIIGSIPASFVGGMLELDDIWYKRLLGAFLFLATIRLILKTRTSEASKKINLIGAVVIGAVIGLMSGLIGIGGGIILSPAILLLGWGNIKETAATSAIFIVVNSFMGLVGYFLSRSNSNFEITAPVFSLVILLAVIGGIAGSSWGSRLKNISILKYILAMVLVLASVKLWVL